MNLRTIIIICSLVIPLSAISSEAWGPELIEFDLEGGSKMEAMLWVSGYSYSSTELLRSMNKFHRGQSVDSGAASGTLGRYLRSGYRCAAMHAQSVSITPIARWAGQTGKTGSGDSGYICNQDRLDDFWVRWQITAGKPEVSFSTELLVFYMGSGGLHLMDLSLNEDGNLVAVYVEAPTVSRYPNYLIFTVPRDGIQSLNGVPVICSE